MIAHTRSLPSTFIMSNPIVSIILSAYNSEKYIEECLNSIEAQTYKKWELIFINDGSKDKTHKLITQFMNESKNIIQYINLEKNKGLSYCLNLGITYSKAKYIARIDADDIMLENRLEEQIKFLEEHPDIGVLGSSAIEIDKQGDDIGILNVPCDDFTIKKLFFSTYPIIHPSVVMRRSLFNNNIIYRDLYPNSEDIDLWLRLSKITNFANLTQPLIKKRTHSEQITMSKRGHYDSLRAKIDFFSKNGILLKNLHHLVRHIIVILFIPNVLYLFLKKEEQRKRRNAYKTHKNRAYRSVL